MGRDYFVSYVFEGQQIGTSGVGYGYTVVHLKKKIKHGDDLRDIAKAIEKDLKVKKVSLLSVNKL